MALPSHLHPAQDVQFAAASANRPIGAAQSRPVATAAARAQYASASAATPTAVPAQGAHASAGSASAQAAYIRSVLAGPVAQDILNGTRLNYTGRVQSFALVCYGRNELQTRVNDKEWASAVSYMMRGTFDPTEVTTGLHLCCPTPVGDDMFMKWGVWYMLGLVWS